MTDTTATTAAPARELPLARDGLLEIVLTSGDLRLRGFDTERVVVRRRDGRALDEDIAIDVQPGAVRIHDGRATLRLGPLSFRASRPQDLDIEMPQSARLSLRTASGDVDAVGVGGSTRFATASGNLRLATTGGAVQVETMSGDATIEATGAIDLGARTVSGDLRVRAPRLATTDVESTSGDIRLEAELAAGGRHALSSVSGDVEVVTRSPVRLETDTITGDVRVAGEHRAEGAQGRRVVIAGAGTVGVSVRTTSGDIRLRIVGKPAGEPASGPGEPPTRPGGPAADLPEAPDLGEAARLDILRALERGELDIDAAARGLEGLEDAGGPATPEVR